MSTPAGPRARSALFAVIAIALGLGAIEGLSAVGLRIAARDDPETAAVAERKHTRYDADLGWVNAPSVHVRDLYGPDRSLTTNARGFRSTRETPDEIPPGKIRLLCSGDSFTLGWGVDDNATWCSQLEELDDRIDAVNLGQGGYGIDQAYLWARRDAASIDRDLHLFTFISEDFQRMRYTSFRGYGKPTLTMAGQTPVAHGTPVPRRRVTGGSALERLNTVRALRRVLGRARPEPEPVLALSTATGLAERALVTLNRANHARGAPLVAIWLPTLPEYASTGTDLLRTTFLRRLRDANILVIDLVEDLRRVPPEQIDRLFLTQDDVVFPVGGRHYSEAGNAFVARVLWERLRQMPPFAESPAPPSPR